MQQFARIGIGPGLDVEAQDASTKRGLARAAIDGKKIIAEAFTTDICRKSSTAGTIRRPRRDGRRPTRDWLFRAVQMLAGFVANDPVEATYFNVSVDGDGKPLTGKNRYVIHFDKGGEPKVKAFWSVTMYNLQVQSRRKSDQPLFGRRPQRHEARRGRRPDNLRAEGLAGADKESNWLPAPDGQFFMIMRTYLPADDIVNQTWQPPKITAVN